MTHTVKLKALKTDSNGFGGDAVVVIGDSHSALMEHRGGDRCRVESYLVAGPDRLQLRRLADTCSAVRIDGDDWRINALRVRQ